MTSSANPDFDAHIRARLAEFGFKPTTYEGQEGVYYSKTQKAEDMPYMREHVVDDDLLYADSMVTVELTPDNKVQVTTDSDYDEEPAELDSDYTFALLLDAGAQLERDDLSGMRNLRPRTEKERTDY